MIHLHDSLSALPGVGPKSLEKYKKLELHTVEDVLCYYPFRYDDYETKSVLELVDGEKAVITGQVVTPPHIQYYGFKRNRLRFSVKQNEFVLSVSFFNQPYLAEKIEVGKEITIWGKWEKAKTSLIGMKLLTQQTDELQPIYHVAQGITQAQVLKLVKSAFAAGYLALIKENLPEDLLHRYRLLDRQTAISAMHFPQNLEQYQQALRRIKFEEFFYFQMHLQLLKVENRRQDSGVILDYDPLALEQKVQELPFSLTQAQREALEEILTDMKSDYHMNRLLQGDVGSGKTVVAGLAIFAASTAGYQAALMVPTEILAEQHFDSLQTLFPDLSMTLLTGKMKAPAKRAALTAIEDGTVHLVIGTHALIQESVNYHKLGLVVIDEQHRFGVRQRRLLREKGHKPDVLMMTATPIPRTLAISAFGEMDVSVIRQLPAGRKTIITRWIQQKQLPLVLDWLAGEIVQNKQAYFVSPLIEESEMLDLKNAVSLTEELRSYFNQTVHVQLLHGKMPPDEKESIMREFKDGKISILVSTTVIEVGVNVPNATVMVIMDADRFGLSQLHQLRGRVGRGEQQSYAILVADPKTESGKERMRLMTETTDGFVLSEADLKMRGSGEIFGTRQSGLPEFQVANIVEDYPILEEARRVASQITSIPTWREEERWKVIANNINVRQELD